MLVGSEREVKQDTLGPCGLGGEEGLSLSYIVHVVVEPGTSERLEVEIADRYEADGWDVRRDPPSGNEVSVRFIKDGYSIGARVDETVKRAAVLGSMGCVR